MPRDPRLDPTATQVGTVGGGVERVGGAERGGQRQGVPLADQ
jgi:hypothetical protein